MNLHANGNKNNLQNKFTLTIIFFFMKISHKKKLSIFWTFWTKMI